MEPLHDLPTLIEGVARVMTGRPDTRLMLAGDGPSRPDIERLAARRLPARVATGSSVSSMRRESPEWLGKAEVYVRVALRLDVAVAPRSDGVWSDPRRE
jgi:hypothetical protein